MTRDELIAAMKATAEAPPKSFTVKGWGMVYVKPLTVEQCDLQQQETDVEGKDRLRFARGAARLICDERGVLIFDPENKDDLELLAKQPWSMLSKVLGMGGQENATTEAGSEAAKNG